MVTTPPVRRRTLLVTAAALALPLGAASAVAAGSGSPNPGASDSSSRALASPAIPAGSDASFTVVAPCRILDTRVIGGALASASRIFSADAPYGGQGGNPAGCGIPAHATAIMVNIGAIAQSGTKGFVKAWATGSAEPNTSVVNFDPSGPVANMVTIPVNGNRDFTMKTSGTAHLFADVAGYYSKPLYATVSSGGGIYAGIASGVVSTTRTGTGAYTVRFNRNVRSCAVTASDLIFAGTRDVTVDNTFDADTDTVTVRVTNTANVAEDTYFHIMARC
jgi:hypothetical protein